MQRVEPSFANKTQLYRSIDTLPDGLKWTCKEITLKGDLIDADGRQQSETLEVWFRDPVDCVRELLGNPMFAKVLACAPEKVYRDKEGKVREINEMWTADWWWRIQVCITFAFAFNVS